MKRSIARLSSDRRIQAVLIAFCFGAFLEGTGGGGAPVAIAGAFLIGLGFKPFEAAVLCLIANTAPVAWGGVGNPIRTLVGVTGLRRMAALGDGRPHPAAVLADPADLAGADDDRLERHLRGPAGAAGGRRLVRQHAVLLVELPRRRPGRHHLRALLAARHRPVPEGVVAAAGRARGRAGSRLAPRRPRPRRCSAAPRCPPARSSRAGRRSSSPRSSSSRPATRR